MMIVLHRTVSIFLGFEGIAVIQHHLLSVCGGDDLPLTVGSSHTNEAVIEEERDSMCMAILYKGVAFLAVLLRDDATVTAKAIPLFIGFLEGFE